MGKMPMPCQAALAFFLTECFDRLEVFERFAFAFHGIAFA